MQSILIKESRYLHTTAVRLACASWLEARSNTYFVEQVLNMKFVEIEQKLTHEFHDPQYFVEARTQGSRVQLATPSF